MQCLPRREAFGAIESCPGDLFRREIVLDEIDSHIKVGTFIIITINIIMLFNALQTGYLPNNLENNTIFS